MSIRSLVCGLAAVLFFLGALSPVRAQAGLDPGLEAYRAGDLEAAATHWRERLEAEGAVMHSNERARLLYDLGNVAYRRSDRHAAIGWYTASLRLRPRDADTWTNLELARSEAGLDPADRGDLMATVRRLVTALTRAESEWLLLGIVLLWAVTLAGEALRGGRAWRLAALVGFGAVLLSAAPLLVHLATAGADPVLVVAQGGARVQSEPRAEAKMITMLDAGAEAEVLDRLPDWVKVADETGTEGWVPRESVFRLRW